MKASSHHQASGNGCVEVAPVGPQPDRPDEARVSLLTGGADRHYAFGLAMSLVSERIAVDFVGTDDLDSPELHETARLTFRSISGVSRRNASLWRRILKTCGYYLRLIRYAAAAKPKVFHILWNNKLEIFDRTLLMLYYRSLRKRVVLTAHNVNAGARDSTDTLLNRLTLRIQYYLADHVFVHTEAMKRELVSEFGVSVEAVTVIPYGVNNAVPDTALTPEQAREWLGIPNDEPALLFFGNIAPYKGLEFLVKAFQMLVTKGVCCRLIIAGRVKKGCQSYWKDIESLIRKGPGLDRIICRSEFIPDSELELYFKGADALVLPYTHIYQSGVLFLGYGFGLPVIATDVGSISADVIECETGYLCEPRDEAALAAAIEQYLGASLYHDRIRRRSEIREWLRQAHSWESVGRLTRASYANLMERS